MPIVHLCATRFVWLSLALAIAVLGRVQQASALTISGYPPPQELRAIIGSAWFVYLEGEIDADDGKRLRTFLQANDVPPTSIVVLNSRGGSLVGGMELGRVIRQHSLSTDVGVKKISERGVRGYEPGVCFSACATAFIGGRFRFLRESSRYGVHRFFFTASTSQDADVAQILSAAVVSYLREMDVDPELFSLATNAGRDEVFEPTRATLKELKVVNNGFTDPRWTIESRSNLIYLKGERDTFYGINKFILFCSNKQVLMHIIFDPQGRDDEVMKLPVHSIVIDGKETPIFPGGKNIQNNWFNASYMLSAEQVRAIRSATSLGLTVKPSYDAPIFLGFNNMPFEDGSEKLGGLLNSCGYGNYPGGSASGSRPH